MSRCAGKIVYSTQKEARKAIKQLGGYFYECELCGLYHRTSENPKLFARRVAAADVCNLSPYTRDKGAYQKPGKE